MHANKHSCIDKIEDNGLLEHGKYLIHRIPCRSVAFWPPPSIHNKSTCRGGVDGLESGERISGSVAETVESAFIKLKEEN